MKLCFHVHFQLLTKSVPRESSGLNETESVFDSREYNFRGEAPLPGWNFFLSRKLIFFRFISSEFSLFFKFTFSFLNSSPFLPPCSFWLEKQCHAKISSSRFSSVKIISVSEFFSFSNFCFFAREYQISSRESFSDTSSEPSLRFILPWFFLIL